MDPSLNPIARPPDAIDQIARLLVEQAEEALQAPVSNRS
jgi:hypothetical protein